MRSHRRKARRYSRFPVTVNTRDNHAKRHPKNLACGATASAEFGGTLNLTVHFGAMAALSCWVTQKFRIRNKGAIPYGVGWLAA